MSSSSSSSSNSKDEGKRFEHDVETKMTKNSLDEVIEDVKSRLKDISFPELKEYSKLIKKCEKLKVSNKRSRPRM